MLVDVITVLAGCRIGIYLFLAYINFRWHRRLVGVIFLCYSLLALNSLYQAQNNGIPLMLLSPYDAAFAQTFVVCLWMVDLVYARSLRWLLREKRG